MAKSTKKYVILISALILLLCAIGIAIGIFFTHRQEKVKSSVTKVVAVTCNTEQGYQIKISFDKSGDNRKHTINPLREYLGDLLRIEDTSGIYFSKSNMTDLEINVPATDWASMPRIITFGTEMDINKGGNGKSSCTLEKEYTVVLFNDKVLPKNKITSVMPIGKMESFYYIKCTFENKGNYVNNEFYLQDNLHYVVVNGKKLSEVDGVQRWYDEDVSELDGGAFGIYIPEGVGLIRNDGTDICTILAGFVVGDDSALQETKSYRFDGNGGVEVVGTEIISCTEETPENGNKKIVVEFSEYGNNHGNAMLANPNGWRNAIKFNEKSLQELGYTCYFEAEKIIDIDGVNQYQLGKRLIIFIPKSDFKNDGTDSLVFETNMLLNTEDSKVDSDIRDTRLIFGFTHEFEVDYSMAVKYTTSMVSDGNYILMLTFDNNKDFTEQGWEEYRAKTTISGTTVGGNATSFKASTSYFSEKKYQIPLALESVDLDSDPLDLTKPITVTLDAGMTAYTSDGMYYVLENAYSTEFVPLQVEKISKNCEGENVNFIVEFNQDGAEATLGGYIDWYKSYIQIRGEKKTADGWEAVTYNMSDAYAGGIGGDPAVKAGGYAGSWYSGTDNSQYVICIKNIMPKTTLDLSRPVYVKVLSGFEQLDPSLTDEAVRVATATLPYDSEEYEFEIAYETLSVFSYPEQIEKGMGTDTVLAIEFDNFTIEADHGAIVEQYRSKVWLDGKSLADAYWGGKVGAWYNKGVYEIHISNDISSDIFSFYKPHTLQIKAGFFMVDPDVETVSADGNAYHLQAKYVLMEDTPVWNIKELPEPIEIDEYYTDLNIKEIRKITETADNQTLTIQFDRAVSYNFLPHINCPVDWLALLSYKADIPSLPYTKAQLDYIVNNGLHTSVKEKILIDGVALGERNDGDSAVFPNSIYVTYGAVSADVLQINFNKMGMNKLDMSKPHTITFLAGFITPLGGRLAKDITFTSDPTTGAWSVTDNG